ncbi:pyrimidine reductase family protein [Actinocrinis puniceicyclus]|uniref:Pyrimidine reductase family protein n=1 Tax=Actinocrinis puniceicyclus TaxID=977794 RepID=A0A8J8BAL8_9ACTN|nr:pyrimidine reductase family protein [Actinocrinis puniceicyclus]
MRQLIPRPNRDVEPDLAVVYAYPGHARRWVRANMVSSADGAAQAEGKSAGLSGEADKKVFRALRGLADVILVGATTVRTEGYRQPAVPREQYARARAAAGQPPAATIAVVSASLDLDFDAPLYREAVVPTITITVGDAPPDRLEAAHAAGEVLIAGTGRADLAFAIDRLAESGRGRILCEGGPHLLAAVAHAGRLDELCLALSPQLIGGHAMRVIDGRLFEPPLPLALHTLLVEDGFLFTRHLVANPRAGHATDS